MASLSVRSADSPDRQGLVQRAIDGDQIALTALLAETRAELVRRVARYIPADLRAVLASDDVVQEAHIEVFRRISTFVPKHLDAFDRWTATIALNRLRSAIQQLRAAKRGGGLHRLEANPRIDDSTVALLDLLVGPGKTPCQSAARREAIAAVHEAINALSDDYRRAVWQVHIEGRTVMSVAEEMGRTERAIHGLCRRGLEKIRAQLGSGSGYLSSRA